jgi:hypothetical protein
MDRYGIILGKEPPSVHSTFMNVERPSSDVCAFCNHGTLWCDSHFYGPVTRGVHDGVVCAVPGKLDIQVRMWRALLD